MKKIEAVIEYNPFGCILFAENYPGCFARAKLIDDAFVKIIDDVKRYIRWTGCEPLDSEYNVEAVQLIESTLNVHDADSNSIFKSELLELDREQYLQKKELALKSAMDFQQLYDSFPDIDATDIPQRRTFYGQLPRTPRQVYVHTEAVTDYYFHEIGLEVENTGNIVSSRVRAFKALEKKLIFPESTLHIGSYRELWTISKLLRRFVWHDRIHAKALTRMAARMEISVDDTYLFLNQEE